MNIRYLIFHLALMSLRVLTVPLAPSPSPPPCPSIHPPSLSLSLFPLGTYDGAEPSVSSVGVHNLLRLAALTGDETKTKQAHPIMAALLQVGQCSYYLASKG